MKISIAQIDCVLGDLPHNHATILKRVEQAAEDGSDLVVFPEMSNSGYDMSVVRESAERWGEGSFVEELQARANAHSIAVICGLAELNYDGEIYSSIATIDKRGGLLRTYSKTHLFSLAGEDKVLTAGDDLVVVPIDCGIGKPIVNVGLMICYDIRFPEMSRKLVDAGADVLVVVAAFPTARWRHWECLTTCRAIENQVYVVAVNRVGQDGDLEFCGRSKVIDPSGRTMVCGDADILSTNIDLKEIARARATMNILSDRRKDLY